MSSSVFADIILDNQSGCTFNVTIFAKTNSPLPNPPNDNGAIANTCSFFQATHVIAVSTGATVTMNATNYKTAALMGTQWWYNSNTSGGGSWIRKYGIGAPSPPTTYGTIPNFVDLAFGGFKFFFSPNPCTFQNTVGPCSPNPAGVSITCTNCTTTPGTTTLNVSYTPFGANRFVGAFNS